MCERSLPGRIVALAALLAATAAIPAGCSNADAPAATAARTTADGPAAGGDIADGDRYTRTTPSRDGIGKVYMGREISQVMGHLGAGWLTRPSREQEERTDLLLDNLPLQPDDVVADIGAGTGYFSFPIAARVPDGKVLAVDIQPEMLAMIELRKARDGIDNVVTVQGSEDDPDLPDGGVDLILLVDAYHEFSFPYEMGAAMARALKPGGRLVLIEYRGEDRALMIKPLHKMTEAQARREMAAVGLQWERTGSFLPTQHFMVFRKPGS